jgi:hypothetical protein
MDNLKNKIESLLISKKEDKVDYLYEENQNVKVLKSLSINVGSIKHLLGTKGIVKNRYTKFFNNEKWYNVGFPGGDIEPFEECELDKRLSKKLK